MFRTKNRPDGRFFHGLKRFLLLRIAQPGCFPFKRFHKRFGHRVYSFHFFQCSFETFQCCRPRIIIYIQIIRKMLRKNHIFQRVDRISVKRAGNPECRMQALLRIFCPAVRCASPPNSSTVPSFGTANPSTIRMKVVLPAPFLPIRP